MRRSLARAALVAIVLAMASVEGTSLPERTPPPDHPCLLPDSLFAPLARADGIETALARLADGKAVLRTVAQLPAPPSRLLSLLEDVEGWPRFIKRIRSLSRIPGERLLLHVFFNAPWPLSDRDYGLLPAVSREASGGGTVFWEAASAQLPPKPAGIVRVDPVRGGFAVTPVEATGGSRLVYTELDSFVETLPAPARDAARSRGPREIVSSLRALLASEAAAWRAPPVPAAGGRARIIAASTLQAEMNSASPPLVLDARSRRDFAASHIPGSRPVDWRDFTAVRPNVGTYFFGDPSRWGLLAESGPKLVTRLRELGLSRGRPIVVAGDPHGWGEEGRIAWMLLALGASDVALLDGGFPAWRNLPGTPIERGSETVAAAGDFDPHPQPGRRILLQELRSVLSEGRRPILDARTEQEFEGKTLRGQKRGGRIPGARLVPAVSLRDSGGRYVSAEALSLLTGPLEPKSPPVTYCTGGVRSALLAVLIEARLGIVAANYDGSLWEWGAHPELPLATGTAR
ncbi:MAG: hypothetical protein DIJKHBIC_02918 [Thermoanaerobaculia bacterium]|nr:hypothetical protein [Thermoanaerobaculia bacterium]